MTMASGAVAASAQDKQRLSSVRRPNIVIFHAHDLGQHVGCYGVPAVRTPAMDGFAAHGVRFERSYCTAPSCSPSRASLFTGRYPHSNGVLGLCHFRFGWDLNANERHLAQLLHDAGYATCAVGVIHETHQKPERWGYEKHIPDSRAAQAVEAAIAELERLRQTDRPFYLWVGTIEPHRLTIPQEPGQPPGDQGFPGPGMEPDDALGVYVPPYLMDTPPCRKELAGLQGAVRHLDMQFGRMLAALDRMGLTDNTLAILTTDHGIAMPRAKCNLYEPGVSIACIMRLPSRPGWHGGVVHREMISNVDMLPTLAEVAGFETPSTVQGRSFAPLLDGGRYRAHDAVFTELTYHDYYDPKRAIRTETHKLIANFTTAPAFMDPSQQRRPRSDTVTPANPAMAYHPYLELYDLAADPWEQTDLGDDPAHAGLRDELASRLYRHMTETRDPILRGAVTSPHHRRTMDMLRKAARAR